MKNLKTNLIFLMLMVISITSAQEVNFDNLIAGASDGYTISLIENIFENKNLENLKTWMDRNKYKYVKDHGSSLEYEKDKIAYFVFYNGSKIIEVRVASSPRDYYYANKFKEGGYTITKVETKLLASGNEDYEVTTYKKGKYTYQTLDYPVYAISVYRE